MFARRINFSFLTFGVVFVLYGSGFAANYQCGYEPQGCDQNPNCSPVMQQCDGPYNGQYLCPINQTACNSSYVCPSGGSYNASVGKCQADPTSGSSCPSGYTYNSSVGKCEASAQVEYICPLGSSYPCVDTGSGVYCSPYQCVDIENSSSIETSDTTQGANDKQDNGPKDSLGRCQGVIRIFNGNDKRCRTAGIETGWLLNCCEKNKFLILNCKKEEQDLYRLRTVIQYRGQDRNYTIADANCHYVGTYCSKKIKFIGCVQKKQTFCCFSSPLARIIQEQGRPQIGKGWGDPENPDCSGFTIDEFQKLDFSKIDFSEWIDMIVGQETTNLQNSLPGQTQQMQRNIQGMYQ